MPELPEVETVRRSLLPVLGATIDRVYVAAVALRQQPLARARLQRLAGHVLTTLERRGKYLVARTDGADALLIHLGMSGRFVRAPANSERPKHTHVELQCHRGTKTFVLRFVDPRRFGQFVPVTAAEVWSHPALRCLGPDPLAERPDPAILAAKLSRRHSPIKLALLDQRLLAGVGNIYASEALFRLGCHPQCPASAFAPAEATAALIEAVQLTLRNALASGGTSLRDFVNGLGQQGTHAANLLVYGRGGEPCPRCGQPIEMTVLGARATYHCPRCQPLGRRNRPLSPAVLSHRTRADGATTKKRTSRTASAGD